ncbi:MAG TPA: tetratricopeptide repeat protein [Micropepsaceae bacterium]|nr:tetratricopeptide repeat protein [Micropepsaceae bacterium]
MAVATDETQLQRARGLHQAGRLAEAADLYQQMLLADPAQFEPFYSLGMIAVETGQWELADQVLGNAMKLNRNFAEGWCARGLVLLHLHRPEQALSCFDQALRLKPNFLDALSSRATALLELNRIDEAIAGFDRVVGLYPGHAISWNNRGNAMAASRRFQEAVESYDRALVLMPGLPQARDNRENALFELKRATRCPPGYMRNLFDNFAPHYDQTMLEKLGYAAHRHLRSLAVRVLPRTERPWRILDLVCGTGLVGESFKDLAAGGRLDGIDLAPRMIEASRARGIYDDLILDDLETALAAPGPRYDLILAADTMIYIGDLEPTFRGVASRLEPGGFYLFAVEGKSGEDWDQTVMHRFRHSESYLRDLAQRSGLEFVACEACTLRHESAVPVAGFAVAVQKPVADEPTGLPPDSGTR